MNKIWLWIIAVVIIFYITISFISNSPNKITGDIILEELEVINEKEKDLFLVTKVIDGDTIDIETGERVRLICIDTPEYDEEGYKDAKEYVEDLILNKKVRLEKDVSETGKYGRLVRYVYLEDGTFVNELIVKQGYGKVYWYKPNITLCPIIQKAEDEAKEKGLGIWEQDKEPEEEQKQPELTPESIPEQNPHINSDISCSANTYNCGDFSSYSEALNVFEICGGVSNDIHRLDADKDGVPCETLR